MQKKFHATQNHKKKEQKNDNKQKYMTQNFVFYYHILILGRKMGLKDILNKI